MAATLASDAKRAHPLTWHKPHLTPEKTPEKTLDRGSILLYDVCVYGIGTIYV